MTTKPKESREPDKPKGPTQHTTAPAEPPKAVPDEPATTGARKTEPGERPPAVVGVPPSVLAANADPPEPPPPPFVVTEDTVDPPVQTEMAKGVMVDVTPPRPADPTRADTRGVDRPSASESRKAAREGFCVVDDGTGHYADGRAVPGAAVCSAHEISHFRDGTPREGAHYRGA